MQQAREVMHASALLGGEKALRRYELLRMRFEEGLPVREIAARFREDPSVVHRAYRKARLEFRASLEQAVNYHCAGSVEEVRAESERLLAMLGSE
jgi:DNA-directed RNA polymerase specialized sigma24 family protein